jgi:ABC-type Mn2+/Zn2+ transport system permease subunit
LTTTSGFSVRLFGNLMLALVAITIIASFQSVGTLLVLGLLVAPAATGALVARSVGAMMAIAALIGTASVYLGLLASYHFDLAAGASIVLSAVVIFAVTATITEVMRSIKDRGHDHELGHMHGSVHVR